MYKREACAGTSRGDEDLTRQWLLSWDLRMENWMGRAQGRIMQSYRSRKPVKPHTQGAPELLLPPASAPHSPREAKPWWPSWRRWRSQLLAFRPLPSPVLPLPIPTPTEFWIASCHPTNLIKTQMKFIFPTPPKYQPSSAHISLCSTAVATGPSSCQLGEQVQSDPSLTFHIDFFHPPQTAACSRPQFSWGVRSELRQFIRVQNEKQHWLSEMSTEKEGI